MPVWDEKSCEQYKTLKITQTKDLKDILPHWDAIQHNLFETWCYTSISDIHMLWNASIWGSLIWAGIDTIASYTGNIMNYPLSMDWSSKNINFSTNSYIQTKETGMPVGWNNEDSFSIVPSNVVNIDDDQYLMSTGGIRLWQSAIYANIQMSECRNKWSSSPIIIDLRSIKNIGNNIGNTSSHKQYSCAGNKSIP